MGKNTYLSVMKTAPNLPLIVLTGLADETLGAEAIHDGVEDYLVKGSMDGRSMARSIRYAIERKQAKEASEDLQKELKAPRRRTRGRQQKPPPNRAGPRSTSSKTPKGPAWKRST